MTHYYDADRVHSAPRVERRPEPARGTSRSVARIDCDTCPIAGSGCGGCMVALLGPVRFRLDAAEEQAVATLSEHGLVTEAEAAGAYAVPDLPDWVVASWPRPAQPDQVPERLRALG